MLHYIIVLLYITLVINVFQLQMFYLLRMNREEEGQVGVLRWYFLMTHSVSFLPTTLMMHVLSLLSAAREE